MRKQDSLNISSASSGNSNSANQSTNMFTEVPCTIPSGAVINSTTGSGFFEAISLTDKLRQWSDSSTTCVGKDCYKIRKWDNKRSFSWWKVDCSKVSKWRHWARVSGRKGNKVYLRLKHFVSPSWVSFSWNDSQKSKINLRQYISTLKTERLRPKTLIHRPV